MEKAVDRIDRAVFKNNICQLSQLVNFRLDDMTVPLRTVVSITLLEPASTLIIGDVDENGHESTGSRKFSQRVEDINMPYSVEHNILISWNSAQYARRKLCRTPFLHQLVSEHLQSLYALPKSAIQRLCSDSIPERDHGKAVPRSQ